MTIPRTGKKEEKNGETKKKPTQQQNKK